VVVVAGNTVEGEEPLVLEAFRSLLRARPGARLILAPRRPGRFAAVADLLAAEGGASFRRASEPWPADTEAWKGVQVLLLDTLGELASAYSEGTVALVGGGWTWHGGHNPVEPAAAGLPVLVGPGFENFEDLVRPLEVAGILQVVPQEDLPNRLVQAVGTAPLRPQPAALPAGLGGALERSLQLVAPYLPEAR
jgi:3-deoxy-D-manno-octulosonic-acid transferase